MVRRATLLAVLCLATLLSGGCVYLRLLSMKHQFARFDEHIVIEDAPGLALRFREPVLKPDDPSTLLGAAATTVEPGPPERRTWVLRREPYDGMVADPVMDVIPLVGEVQDKRIVRVILPEQIFRLWPRELAIAMLRSMGKASIDQGQRSATAEVAPPPQAAAQVPTRQDVRRAMGDPHESAETEGERTETYRYRVDGGDGKPSDGRARLAFVYDADGRLARVRIQLAAATVVVAYPRGR